MKYWRDWFPDLMPHVQGCPLVVAEHELRRAAQAFFRATRAWKEVLAPIAVSGTQDEVDMTPVDTALDLVRVESVTYDGKQLGAETASNLDASHQDDWTLHTGTPSHYIQMTPNILRLYPVPVASASSGLVARVSVTPSGNSTGLPDDLAIHFWDAIHIGAKSRLMLYPKATWTNPDSAVAYGAMFGSMVDSATVAAAKSYGAARIPARPKWC